LAALPLELRNQLLGSFSDFILLVLGDPCLSVGFGGERADLGRMSFGDADLDGERPVLNWVHPIGRLGVGMRPLCH